MILPTPRPTLFPYTTLFRSPSTTMRPSSMISVGVTTAPRRAVSAVFLSTWNFCDAVTSLIVSKGCRNATSDRSEEHTSELQSRGHLVCRLLLEKKKEKKQDH